MNNEERGKRLARAIFECGDFPNDKTQRIQFKGACRHGEESDLGGFAEVPLAGFIANVLNRLDAESEKRP